IRVQGFQVARRVFEGLALFERRSLGGEIYDIGAEPNRGQLEANPRASGWLDEKVDDSLAAQGRNLLDGALPDGFERAGGVDDNFNLLGRERLDVEQMFAVPGHNFSKYTMSGPPCSFNCTSICSLMEVGTFLPTK